MAVTDELSYDHAPAAILSTVGGLQKLLWVLLMALMLLPVCVPAFGAERWSALAQTAFQHVVVDKVSNLSAPGVVTQDGEGFIWIGTQGGLARWDGYRYHTYKSDSASEGTLPDDFIVQLHTDRQGQLWITTASGTLARYDRDRDRFVTYPIGRDGPSHGRVYGIIYGITADAAEGVWVATDDGLYHVLAGAGSVSHLGHGDGGPGSLPGGHLYALLRSRDGTVWVGGDSGLFRQGPGQHTFSPVPLLGPDVQIPTVWTLFEDSQQRIWIGTLHNGAYVMNPKEVQATPVLERELQHSTLPTMPVYSIAEVRSGEVWMGTPEGIVVVEPNVGLRTHRIRHDPLRQDSLASDDVSDLYRDSSGLLWIVAGNAVDVYHPNQGAVYEISAGREITSALAQMPDGRLWFGLLRNGVDIVDAVAGPITGLRAANLYAIRAFARADSGDVYVGTVRGLYRMDPSARSAARLTLTGVDPGIQINALLLQGKVLWAGGQDGLWGADASSSRAGAQAVLAARKVEGLSNPWVQAIEPGPEGSLWVGTRYGLNRVDPASGTVERILPDAHDAGALASGFVTTILTDRRGRLWVGTFGQGIDLLEGRDQAGRPRFRHLSVAQGLDNENINKLLADSHGRIWASTDDGLSVIDPVSLKIRNLRRAEGVVFSSNLDGVGTVTDAGEIVFGTTRGLTVVRPDQLKSWSYQPPVVVTDVRIGGKVVPSSSLNSRSRAHAPLTITPGANSLTVEFAALDYSAPERNLYAFKLDGFETDWTATDSYHRVAAYTNLPPGDYRLRLRGSNRDGVWTDAGMTVPIRVLPAWFQTLTFRLLATVAVLGLLTLVYRLRLRYIAQQWQERHRTRLAERDRIARELHDTLLQSTEGLILKVHSVVDHLHPDSPDRALLSAALDRASELAYEGRERIQDLRGARPRAELGQVLEKVAREMAQGSATRFALKLEGCVRELRPYIWEELYRIAYEALWNAYRHSRAGLITVSVSYGPRELHILIGDDGRGIPLTTLRAAPDGHFGLAGMRERAHGLNARLKIESQEGGGTRVEIRISSALSYVA